jgi:hypothetical protein
MGVCWNRVNTDGVVSFLLHCTMLSVRALTITFQRLTFCSLCVRMPQLPPEEAEQENGAERTRARD